MKYEVTELMVALAWWEKLAFRWKAGQMEKKTTENDAHSQPFEPKQERWLEHWQFSACSLSVPLQMNDTDYSSDLISQNGQPQNLGLE